MFPACFAAISLLMAAPEPAPMPTPTTIAPKLEAYIASRVTEFPEIPEERRQQLQPLADYIRQHAKAGKPIRLTFICTHNSRRSHLSQVWAQTAAAYYKVGSVESFSGGTEATAFNPRAVAALRRAGFEIPELLETDNPRYVVRLGSESPAMTCFSKKYDDSPNPKSGFAAVMTCTQADKACPIVGGAEARIAIPYEDPKAFDNTPDETRMYDERTAQIARELLYVFSIASR